MKGYNKIKILEIFASNIGQINYCNIWGAYKWRESKK